MPVWPQAGEEEQEEDNIVMRRERERERERERIILFLLDITSLSLSLAFFMPQTALMVDGIIFFGEFLRQACVRSASLSQS